MTCRHMECSEYVRLRAENERLKAMRELNIEDNVEVIKARARVAELEAVGMEIDDWARINAADGRVTYTEALQEPLRKLRTILAAKPEDEA